MDNTSFRKCIEELASPTVVWFDANKIIPSKDLDAYDTEHNEPQRTPETKKP